VHKSAGKKKFCSATQDENCMNMNENQKDKQQNRNTNSGTNQGIKDN
jgi:hypothetical protein